MGACIRWHMKRGDFLDSYHLTGLSTLQESQDLCAHPACQCSTSGTFHWTVLVDWRSLWLTHSGTHSNSIKETPQWVFLFILVGSPLPLTASTCEELTLTLHGITLFINRKLWQVKVQGLSVIVSDCKSFFKAMHRQVVTSPKTIQHAQSVVLTQ